MQWSLDHTSTSVVGMARGILHAATTDNVQPLAILACEQFGNTLAMSQDTIRKIEHSVVPTSQPAILAFLKSTAGYSANDSVSYLGKNTAGLQFLGLAAALVTFTDIYKAAQAVQSMLASTAKDKTLLPTARQVRDLLTSIEPRCHRSGFAEDVAGWQLLLGQHPELAFMRSDLENIPIYSPGGAGLKNLVDALRQLNRLGSADITKVTVRTVQCAPWTISFVKWSLGYPPSVVCNNTATPVLEQPGSKVTIVIPADKVASNCFDVTIHSSIHGPSDLVGPNLRQMTAGMVSLQMYGQGVLQYCDFNSGLAGKAFQEAIPYALHLTVKELSKRVISHEDNQFAAPKNHVEARPGQNFGKGTTPSTSLRHAFSLSPFRGESAISRIYELLFNQKLELISTQDNISISKLPYVALLERECRCDICHPHASGLDDRICNKGGFYKKLSWIVADVLALSLVDCPDLLQVSNNVNHGYWHGDSFLERVTRVLRNKSDTDIGVPDLLNRAMKVLGHDVNRIKRREWVASSSKGQAVWPTIYETHSYGMGGYLSLSWHPGLLRHKGETYNLAHWSQSSILGSDRITGICKDKVQSPCNLCPGMELDWMVSTGEDSLDVALSVRCGLNEYHSIGLEPARVLTNLAKALLVEDCPHNPTSELDFSDTRLKFSGPLYPCDPSAGISVVAVDGDDGLRFIALSTLNNEYPVVLRKRACLACCLEICQKTGSPVVVL